MLLRRVSISDREKIASFVERLPRECVGLDIGKKIFDMKHELAEIYLRNLNEKRLFEVLVAEENNRIVGICDIRSERSEEAFQHVAEVGIMVWLRCPGTGGGFLSTTRHHREGKNVGD